MIQRPKNTEGHFLKKSKYFLTLFLFLAVIISGFFWWQWATTAISDQPSAISKTFVIRKGESLSSVANRLGQEGLIRSPLAFKILVLSSGLTGKIQAGSFHLNPSLGPKEIADLLTHGTADIWLTFPEGWRREEFARRLAANLDNFDYQEFLRLTEGLEGELFPDTYLIPKQATPSAIVKIFLNNFEKKFADLEQVAQKSGLTKRQVLILASMVEREVRYKEDRPIVAGILIKRWRENWPLQVDATIQYEVGSGKCGGELKSDSRSEDGKCDWWSPLKKADLEIDSPYNSYKYKGLPPTPICNPGLASIKAVIYPQLTDYWFYLSDLEGKIHYAKTIEEHSANVKAFLKN